MKFSEKWLREWVNPSISREALAQQLILAGLEVESITPEGDDAVFELSITPNRGDCLSIAGIAREIAAINRLPVTAPDCMPIAAMIPDLFAVSILPEAEVACPRYVGRVIRDINPAAKTPDWMCQRLLSGGIEPKMPVVDIINYVMLELGQPMHAFDLTALSDAAIQIRMAKAGESIQLLNDQTLKLQPDTLVIADSLEAHAIAGVMGGAKSAVKSDSRAIFLESAFFAPEAIIGRARRYGLQTDSAYRFERGVDSALQAQAIERATALVLEIMGGQAGPLILKESKKHIPEMPTIELRAARVEQILGIAIPDADIEAILTGLGMTLSHSKGIWKVIPPSYRFDIRIEADLIEEIVRLYGYERLETVHMLPVIKSPLTPFCQRGESETKIPLTPFRQVLVNRGYREAITYSFVDPKLQQLLHPNSESFCLVNPISPELSVMRVGLWPGLLTALQYNYNRQQSRIRLFETGLYFHPDTDQQEPAISGVVIGSAVSEQWGTPGRSADFFDVKNDVEALLALTGQGANFVFEPKERHAFHPQQASCIKHNGREIGWLGRLNPLIEQKLGFAEPVYLFEFMLKEIEQAVKPAFTALPKFPSVRRDIAILVDKAISATAIKQAIQSVQKDNGLLDQMLFFDVYEGKGVPSHQKSIALGLVFQNASRTLTDDEVNVQMGQIVDILQQDLKAILRS
jgi:phenylalanyl-tRNA synthetase beta chain